jgi:hypothetical protein
MTDAHHEATGLTKPQQRMLRGMLTAATTHAAPVRPWRSEWRSAQVLVDRGLAVLVNGDAEHRDHLRLTEAGEQWATVLEHLGKP